MSAFIVTRTHIDTLVSGAIDLTRDLSGFAQVTRETGTDVGRMLWRENHRSVRFRYRTQAETANDEARIAGYTFRYRSSGYGAIAKAVDCYAYQACECDDWDETSASRFVDDMRRALVCQLADYEAAPWTVPDDGRTLLDLFIDGGR